MKKIVYILIILPLITFAVVDIKIKKENEISINTSADFSQNEIIDLNPVFTDTEVIDAKQGLILTSEEEIVMNKVLKNELISANELPHFISAMNKQIANKQYTQDEKKYIAGLKGNNNAADRMKYHGKRNIK